MISSAGRDTITDFTRGSDLIDVSALNASRFIGTSLFTGTAGDVRYAAFDGTTILEVDSNGDRVADFQVAVDGISQLAIGDFIGVETVASTSGGGKKGPGWKAAAASSPTPDGAEGGGHFHHYDSYQMTSGDYLI